VEALTFDEVQRLFYIIAEYINQALDKDLDEDVREALKMHLLLSEILPIVESSFNAMNLPSFLAMYYIYLFSGLFAETPQESDEKIHFIFRKNSANKDA